MQEPSPTHMLSSQSNTIVVFRNHLCSPLFTFLQRTTTHAIMHPAAWPVHPESHSTAHATEGVCCLDSQNCTPHVPMSLCISKISFKCSHLAQSGLPGWREGAMARKRQRKLKGRLLDWSLRLLPSLPLLLHSPSPQLRKLSGISFACLSGTFFFPICFPQKKKKSVLNRAELSMGPQPG